MMIVMITTILASISFISIKTLSGAIFAVAVLGFCGGASIFIRYPIFSDIIDEATILDGKRREGAYQGVLTFFDRFGILLQPVIFTIIHIITEFDPLAAIQTPLAQEGIIAAMIWVPALVVLLAAIIFWKAFDLTPEKTALNKAKLKELKL